MAKALLPSTTAAWSDVAVADGCVSAGNLLIGKIIKVRSIVNKNFTRVSKKPSTALIGPFTTHLDLINVSLIVR
jgi:predicted ribosomally synthesized peptide with SipW-like signal peptide